MKKIAVLFANGTEEIEGITPVDVLRRAGATCDVVSVSGEYPVGSHGITIKAEILIENIDGDSYDAVVIPGGMPGAVNISSNFFAVRFIKKMVDSGKLVCAICASPAVVLARHDLLHGKKATCYPAEDFISSIKFDGEYTGASVERDGNLITANGPKSAMDFSIEIVKALDLTPAI